MERLEQNLGIPLPAATQWEIAKGAAEKARPAHEELIRQAAQGEVLHNDDTRNVGTDNGAGGTQFCNVTVTCGRSLDSVAPIRHPYVSGGVYRIAETKTSRNVGFASRARGAPSSAAGKG